MKAVVQRVSEGSVSVNAENYEAEIAWYKNRRC